MSKRFSVESVFKMIDKVTRPTGKMQNAIKNFTAKGQFHVNQLSKKFDKLTGKMKRVAAVGGAALAGLGAGMVKLLKPGVAFEQTLVNASAKFGKGAERGTAAFTMLEDAARRTGATTEFSATQSAEALNFLAMAGFNAEQAVAALPGVVDLATAAGVELGEATDIASDALGSFGMMTDDPIELGKNLQRVNDILAKTTTTANTTMQDMFETIKDGAPVAISAGSDIQTFAALTGELANAGIKGTKAGTTLKNMFLSLSAPGRKAQSVLDGLGVNTKDNEGNLRDVTEIIRDLNKGLAGMGTADRSAALKDIFGKIPIAGVNVLLDSGADKLQAYRKRLDEANGAAGSMANTMRDTVQGSLNSLKSAIEGVSISIFKMNDGALKKTIDRATEWVRANEEIIAQNIGDFIAYIVKNLDNFIAVGKGIAAIVAIFTALKLVMMATNSVFMIINGTIATYNLALAALAAIKTVVTVGLAVMSKGFLALGAAIMATPIGWIIALIAGLIAVGYLLVKNWDKIKAWFLHFWGFIKYLFKSGVDVVKERIGFLFKPIQALIDAAKAVGNLFSDEDNPDDVDRDVKTNFSVDSDDIPDQESIGRKVIPSAGSIASVQQQLNTNAGVVTKQETITLRILDDSGKAVIEDGEDKGTEVQLIQSGAF